MASKEELKEKFSTGKVPTGDDFSELIDGVEGEQGPQGDPGPAGSDGSDGEDGKDGFGTESQYNDIIERLVKIEEIVLTEGESE
ncbi:collagen-like protein [Oceanobacillus sojae]|uniref:collagen-like protein n=1 Tax=Oceanobacillus sojae TaxID=582851 RepID=UPI001C3798B3|nr:collagen-like protein [Oceanobacillus sojae]